MWLSYGLLNNYLYETYITNHFFLFLPYGLRKEKWKYGC